MEDDELTTQKAQAVFEFTKRKRWADILISELVNVAVFVFSNTGTIIHCDAAVQPVTGYTEEQVLSKNFSEFLHEGDRHTFFKAFEECIAVQRELTFYLRIRASDPRDPSTRLIELKANPYYAPGTTECLCVFSILSPYPSPAVSDLDDFLALRIENERLALQLEVLRTGNYSDDTLDSDTEGEEEMHGKPPLEENIVDRSERAIAQASAVLGAVAAGSKLPSASATFSSPTNDEVAGDGQPIKKKRRLTESSQGRVCTACGRNNSPEWRKGPQGPKTLCNACGLRWAKKAKGPTREAGMDAD